MLNGWEMPNWFAPEGVEPVDDYSYRRSRCSVHTGDEARAVRDGVGLVEMTPMAKFEVSGPGAEARLSCRFGLSTERVKKRAALHCSLQASSICFAGLGRVADVSGRAAGASPRGRS